MPEQSQWSMRAKVTPIQKRFQIVQATMVNITKLSIHFQIMKKNGKRFQTRFERCETFQRKRRFGKFDLSAVKRLRGKDAWESKIWALWNVSEEKTPWKIWFECRETFKRKRWFGKFDLSAVKRFRGKDAWESKIWALWNVSEEKTIWKIWFECRETFKRKRRLRK